VCISARAKTKITQAEACATGPRWTDAVSAWNGGGQRSQLNSCEKFALASSSFGNAPARCCEVGYSENVFAFRAGGLLSENPISRNLDRARLKRDIVDKRLITSVAARNSSSILVSSSCWKNSFRCFSRSGKSNRPCYLGWCHTTSGLDHRGRIPAWRVPNAGTDIRSLSRSWDQIVP
jgi:hypothetical protein